MKPKTTLFLIALLVLCVAYVAVRKTGLLEWLSPQDEPLDGTARVFSEVPSGAKCLTIKSADGREVVFEKTDGQWNIISPIRAKAEAFHVNRITDTLLDLTYQREVPPNDEDASDEITGLDKPRWVVTLLDQKNIAYTIEVGSKLPKIGSSLNASYVRSGDKIYVVQVDLGEMLGQGVSYFRSKTILDIKRNQISGVTVYGKESYELTFRGGKWRIVQPIFAATDRDAVNKLLGYFRFLTASQVVEDNPKSLVRYGLDKPSLIIHIQTKAPQPSTSALQPAEPKEPKLAKRYSLALGRTIEDGKKVFAKLLDEPAVFKLDGKMLELLQPRLIDLRNRKILTVNADEVRRVGFTTATGKIVLLKHGDQWRLTSPFAGKASNEVVERIISDINSLRAENFIDDPATIVVHGLDPPFAKIIFHPAVDGKTGVILIGSQSPSGEMTFVKSSDSSAVAAVPSKIIRSMLKEPTAFWDTTLMELSQREQITQLRLQHRGGVAVELFKDNSGLWKISKPIDASADMQNLNKIFDKLEKLTASRVVSVGEQVPSKYSKAGDQIALEITISTAAEPEATTRAATAASEPVVKKYRLRVSRLGINVYAWLEGQEITPVGLFAAALYDDLSAELRDRLVWKIAPDDINDIKIIPSLKVKPLHLHREGQKWIYTADPHVKIDADKVSSFLQDIQEIRAERFVSYNSADAARFSLSEPWLTIELTGSKVVQRLLVAPIGEDKTSNRYATAKGLEGVFLLSAEQIGKLGKLVGDFK